MATLRLRFPSIGRIGVLRVLTVLCISSIMVHCEGDRLNLNSMGEVLGTGLIVLENKVPEAQECLLYDQALMQSHPDMGLHVDEIIKKHGYPVESYDVTAKEDGYISTVFRIPFGSKPNATKTKRKAVFLNHCLWGNSHTFLYQHGTRNLAFLLAESGFDVFLGNARGSSYSMKHANASLLEERSYWDFSWHEMGKYDVPAIINFIVELTGNQKIYYVGHSMGCASYVTAVSQNPYLNGHIHAAFLLAPPIFMGHTTSLLKFVKNDLDFKTVRNGKLDIFSQLKDKGVSIGRMCTVSVVNCGICASSVFLLYGYNGPQMNFTTLPYIVSTYPDQMSTKSLLHFTQIIESGKFRQFDYGSPEANQIHYGAGMTSPPEYNLTSIKTPLLLYFGEQDNVSVPKDVEWTAKQFQPGVVKNVVRVADRFFNHLDFIIAKDADKLVYNSINNVMQSGMYEQ